MSLSMAVRAGLLLVAWTSAEAGAAACEAGRCEEERGAEEWTDVALLQTGRKRSHGSKVGQEPPPPPVHRALALAGNAWKAQATQVGLLSGLLAFFGSQPGGGEVQCPGSATTCSGNQCCLATPESNQQTFPCPSADAGWSDCGGPAPNVTFLSSGLLANFSTYSSNSGGSWFTSSLVYSKTFMEMLEQMAVNPMTAGEIYNELYTDPLMHKADSLAQVVAWSGRNTPEDAISDLSKPGEQCLETINMVNKTLDKVLPFPEGSPEYKLVELVLDLMAGYDGIYWQDFIHLVLERTAGTTALSLGDAVNEFAKGKTWQACSSLPTGGANLSWAQYPDTRVYLQASSIKKRSISHQVKLPSSTSAAFPPYLPIKFSFQLGAGRAASAPRPFCANAECFNMSFTYEMTQLGSKAYTQESPPLGATFEAAFGAAAGQLPVYQVAAASSAFAGGVVYEEAASMLYGDCLNFAVPVCDAPDGEAFQAAQDLGMPNVDAAYSRRDHEMFDNISKKVLTPLVDGGYTDNSGIAWAVAGGATEVVSILNTDAVVHLFAPSNKMYGPDNVAVQQVWFQVFQEPYTDVLAQLEGNSSVTGAPFVSLEIPTEQQRFLDGFVYGTTSATTADSPWFGIKAGIPVKIHIFLPKISLQMADVPMTKYGVAIGEIMQTMLYEPNRDKVEDMLSLVMGGTAPYR